MTYAPVQSQTRYQNYQEYLDDESLSSERNYRLLSTGELIEAASEDNLNLMIAHVLGMLLSQIDDGIFKKRVRNGNKELQVPPVGDKQVSRKPDVMVLHPNHLEVARQAIKFGMESPLFVAEVVSPGPQSSSNYQRDYVWKRQQYQGWQIPEYWIVDPHLVQVTVLVLVDGEYQETVYTGQDPLTSSVFPAMTVTAQDLIAGNV
ncbi:MAG: Uma2 family endonuclease [Cyanobacteria bacterium J06598_3]